MSNTFRKKNIPTLVEQIGATLSVVIENPTDYGVNTSECEALGDLKDELIVLYANAEAANQAKLAAYETRNAKWNEVLDSIGDFTKRIYAKPDVDDTLLLKAGLAPRPVSTARPPQRPLNLVANPSATGEVELTWSRNGNAPNAVFVVETKSSTGNWTIVGQYTRTRITVSGFTPGVTKYFRVTATRNNASSLPSNETLIYGSSGSSELSIAA